MELVIFAPSYAASQIEHFGPKAVALCGKSAASPGAGRGEDLVDKDRRLFIFARGLFSQCKQLPGNCLGSHLELVTQVGREIPPCRGVLLCPGAIAGVSPPLRERQEIRCWKQAGSSRPNLFK